MVQRVADVNGTVRTDADAVGAVEQCGRRGAAVAAATFVRWTAARDRADLARLHVDHADRVVLGIDDVQILIRAERDSLRAVERRFLRGAAVASEALLAGAGHV